VVALSHPPDYPSGQPALPSDLAPPSLHHYKNEHYWFGVSTSGVSTACSALAPDPAQTATSPTVRDLHAREAG